MNIEMELLIKICEFILYEMVKLEFSGVIFSLMFI